MLREIGHCDPLEVRPTICRTALALCDGAHAVSLWELGPDGALTTTATLPETTAPYRVAGTASEHGAHYVMRTGTPLFVAEAAESPHCDRRIITLLGAESVLFIPIGSSGAAGGARGALAISWPAQRGRRRPTTTCCSSACSRARRRSRCSAPTCWGAWTS